MQRWFLHTSRWQYCTIVVFGKSEEEEEFRPHGVAPSMNDLLEVKYNMR